MLQKSYSQKKTIKQRRSGMDRRLDPSEKDKIVNDILKHLTTLNTGLLAILAAFSDRLADLLALQNDYGMYFLLSFYLSLVLCMIGFMLMIFSLRVRNDRWRTNIKLLRDATILFAALGYIAALMFFTTLYASSF